ncbi:hypothetical protein Q8F55_001129 [Vanrija albida]|uniref:Peroxisomal membrane protein PEX16 n=1 Tax=Vanrija albida TaxID=181172 RepID=A0ABR3QF78_9TREE
MASSVVAAYEQLLVDNVSTVRTVESAIRNVTWFLPGRFADADIASEGLYALLSVVSSVHDDLLEKRIPPSLSLPPHPFAPGAAAPETAGLLPSTVPPAAPITPLLPPASEHTRYTRYWSDRSPAYRRLSRALQTTTYVELLLEMLVKKKAGERNRWRLVLGIEGFKSILRLILMTITRRAVLLPPTPQREFDFALIPQDKILPPDGVKPKQEEKKVQPTGPARAVIPSLAKAPLRSHLYPLLSSLPEEHLTHPLSLLPELSSPGDVAAEVLSSTAVLVQVLLLVHAMRSPNAPRFHPASLPTLSRALPPFIIPILLQLLARRLRAPAGESTLLAEHYAQLDRRMASRFFLQGPMWIGWTRPKIVSVVNFLEKIPLISLAGDLISGYLPLVDDYFYTVT